MGCPCGQVVLCAAVGKFQGRVHLTIDDSVTEFALRWTTSSVVQSSNPKTSTPSKLARPVKLPSFTIIEERHSF